MACPQIKFKEEFKESITVEKIYITEFNNIKSIKTAKDEIPILKLKVGEITNINMYKNTFFNEYIIPKTNIEDILYSRSIDSKKNKIRTYYKFYVKRKYVNNIDIQKLFVLIHQDSIGRLQLQGEKNGLIYDYETESFLHIEYSLARKLKDINVIKDLIKTTK